MSTVKLSALPELATAAADDVLLITDTDAATSKKITRANLVSGLATSSALTTHTSDTTNPHSVTATQVGLGNVENTALSTWAGSTNLTTLGTVTAGTWTGTAIGDSYISSAANWNTAYGWGNHATAGYLTSESNDLTAAVTWANVPDANITQSSVTQHQAALSITEGQISNLGSDIVLDSDIGVTVQGYDADTAKLDTAQTWTAQQTFGELKEGVYSLTGTAIDPANGSIQYKTLAANTTFTESLEDGQSVVLLINGGATYTVTWPTMTWATSGGNVAPTLTANDVIVMWQANSTVYGAYVGSYT